MEKYCKILKQMTNCMEDYDKILKQMTNCMEDYCKILKQMIKYMWTKNLNNVINGKMYFLY